MITPDFPTFETLATQGNLIPVVREVLADQDTPVSAYEKLRTALRAENPDAYWPFHSDAEATRRMIALNYGAITMIDDWIGRILDALEQSGKAGNTVVVFMSDHGDYMGDHGTVLKHGLHTDAMSTGNCSSFL
mgnify:CR=1 FL=1